MSIEFEARAARSKLWPFRESRLGGKLVERGLGFIEGYVAGASRPVNDLFDNVTRITVVTEKGVVFERYNLFEGGVDLHLQDNGRTLKIFPLQK